MRDELIEQVLALADDPMRVLIRSSFLSASVDVWQYKYDSQVALGLCVILLVADIDPDERSLRMIAISTMSRADNQ